MNPTRLTMLAVLILSLSTVACDRLKPAMPELDKKSASEAPAVPSEGDRLAITRSAEKEIEELRAAIAQLQSKASSASQEATIRLKAEIADLEAELQATRERLAALKTATAESWTQLNNAFVNSLRHLKEAVEKTRKSTE